MEADGSYFIDGDVALFEPILRYLRRGVLPLFYDNAKGHDLYLVPYAFGRGKGLPNLPA
jgi:hypothetical protein